jgi:hypothetical protein
MTKIMTSQLVEYLFQTSYASPPGGLVAVTSDDSKESDFHRGTPGKGKGMMRVWEVV